MRPPVRSEADAFWLVIVITLVVGLALVVGDLLGPIPGGTVIAVALFAWLAWDLTSGPASSRLRDAERVGHREGIHARRLMLVVANATPPGPVLMREIVRPGDALPVLDVVAPVLQSRTHFMTTDIDREVADAQRRLDTILVWASKHGLRAGGQVGDPIDPVAGIADELRRYDVDEVVVTRHAGDDANWVEVALLEALRAELRAPVRELVVHDTPTTNAGGRE